MSAIDRLADKTGLGELGALFSLVALLIRLGCRQTAAAEGHAELAISSALGGIAIQTVFLDLRI